MVATFHEGGNAENYSHVGCRMWFSRLVDSTTSPVKYEGFRDMGNIVDQSDTQENESYEHYTAKSGVSRLDLTLTKKIKESLVLTLDELCVENLRNLFRAGDVTHVDATTGEVTAEVAQLNRTETAILGDGYAATNIVVKSFDGVCTFDKDVDYEEVDVIGGYIGIKRIEGGNIADGEYVQIAYDYTVRAHRLMAPGTDLSVIGMARFFAVSNEGAGNFIREIRNVQLTPEGDFKLQIEEPSQMQIKMDILDDTDTVAAYPFGKLKVYGKGADL